MFILVKSRFQLNTEHRQIKVIFIVQVVDFDAVRTGVCPVFVIIIILVIVVYIIVLDCLCKVLLFLTVITLLCPLPVIFINLLYLLPRAHYTLTRSIQHFNRSD